MKKNHLLLLLIFATQVVWGQVKVVDTERFAFEPNLEYQSGIESPGDFLGYELGAHMTEYERVTQYFEQLAASSPRVIINQYGKTYEGRPLFNLVISSEENIENIDRIQARHAELPTANADEAADIIENEPVITSFSYNIHGNEFSTTEAAMQAAYRMAAANDSETMDILDNSVIIMFICINPDGRNRYAYWYNSMARIKTPGIEPRDLEHYAPWPNGRTNHYWFDLNRDWIWGIHPESRGHIKEYQKWMPQVHVDYHEQGYNSNYFTMPGTTPRNQQLPDTYEAWTDTFGMANVRAFDKKKLNYFTRTSFDFFFPSYGSSYPSVLGAIGMLTEQGGIGGGKAIETNDGYILTLRQRVFDHYTTTIATIKKSKAHKQALLQYSYDSWQAKNSKIKTSAYLFDATNVYSKDVVNILLRNGVEVEELTGNVNASVTDFRTGETSQMQFGEGTYYVSTDQPRNLFITTVMERNMAIEDSVMYDMSTWAAPLAYNLNAYAVNSKINPSTKTIAAPLAQDKGLANVDDPYAYVIDWSQRNAPKALAKLWAKGYRVRAADEPFTDQNDQTYPEGSLIVLAGRNLEKKASINSEMASIADEAEVKIQAYTSGRMKIGMDLASSKNRPIKQPKVALMVEPPFNTYTCGQIYFLFDQETELPVERIRTSILQQTAMPKFGNRYGGADLNDYDVLILAGGGNGLSQLFKKEQIAQLKAWVQAGGVIVATENAANFFTKKASGLTNLEIKKIKQDTSDAVKYLSYKDRTDYFGKKRIPGTALNAHIDATHPLAFGMDRNVYTLKFGNTGFEPSSSLQSVGYYYKDPKDLYVAGYASQENLDHLAGTTFAGVIPMGSGKIVLLADNTQYRMFWRGPSRMMQNAVMLLPGF